MKTLHTVPLVVGAISLASVAVQANESKFESPTLSATDKIEIIETIEITSEKEIDSSESEELDEDVAAILKEAEADAIENTKEASTLSKAALDSIDKGTKLVKRAKIESDKVNTKVKLTIEAKDVEGGIELKKSKRVKLRKNSE